MTCSQPSNAYIPTPKQDAITSKKYIRSTHQHVLPRECTYLILDHVWTTWHVEGQGKPVCSAVFASHVPIPGSQLLGGQGSFPPKDPSPPHSRALTIHYTTVLHLPPNYQQTLI